jgi:hypothetical protein
MRVFAASLALLLLAGNSGPNKLSAQQEFPRFLQFDEVRDIIAGFAAVGLADTGASDAGSWDAWIRARDRETRARVDRGFEDSISNFILYGTSFTTLPRVDSYEAALKPDGELSEATQARIHALAAALARPPMSERLRLAHEFVKKRLGDSSSSESAVEIYFRENLKRFIQEQRGYQQDLQAAAKAGDPGELLLRRSTLFAKRGLSADTSLLPNWALEDTLGSLVRKGVLRPGSIRRLAVIGPGMDFVDKRDGYDFYPLQTLQPFALLEAVGRLGLAQPDDVEVVAFDLNPAVVAHLLRLAEDARRGHAYVVQLPRDTRAGWKQDALAYWEHFGDLLGSPTAPLPVPTGLSGVVSRAVAIRPRYAAQVRAVDLDVVAQTLDPQPGTGFDLVVATNVLVYYDLFEQALAMASLAHLMNREALFLANHALPSQHPPMLQYLGRRGISYSHSDKFGDDVVVYARR